MAEDASVVVDSVSTEAAPAADSVDDSPVLGAELFEADTSEAASDEDIGHSPATTTSPGDIDILRANVDELPDDLRPLQGIAKGWQGQFTRAQQDLRDQQRAAQEREDRYLNLLQTMAPQQAAQPTQEQVAEQQFREQLSEEETRGIGVVDWRVDSKMAPVAQEVAAIKQQLDELRGTVSNVSDHHSNAVRAAARNETAEAIGRYGQEEVSRYSKPIMALTQEENLATGEFYTVTEAYETVAGLTGSRAQDARAQDANVRNGAKRSARNVSVATTTADDGPMSQGDALNAMGALGFD